MRFWSLACLALACAPAAGDDVAARREAILGGTPDVQSTSVFFVIATFNNGQMGLCSGTLVSPRVILTAAHCVDPAREGATSVMVRVMNEPDDTMLMMSDLRNVVQVRRHPSYSGQGPNDLALLQLDAPVVGVTPELLVRTPPPSWAGQPIRVVGYGRTSASGASDTGTRRVVNTTIARTMSETFEFGAAGALGLCSGDSGGPSFWRGPDGRERVAGVHSYGTTNQCGAGGDVRVDAELAFLDQTLNQLDPPACGADGRCQSGCTPVDPDCTCIADARCEACPDGRVDPDCPANCVANGVCQSTGCPVVDADCFSDGDVCSVASECVGDRCLDDPRGFRFCSRPCADDSVCQRQMRCVDQVCRPDPSAPRPMPTPAEPVEDVRGGCQASAGPGWSFLLLFLRRRRA
ncbi:MAG: S1 family peptidase [Myxococcaceae bacterium]|nr:S1 family peptidase [Myxococcaceae bacterium]